MLKGVLLLGNRSALVTFISIEVGKIPTAVTTDSFINYTGFALSFTTRQLSGGIFEISGKYYLAF